MGDLVRAKFGTKRPENGGAPEEIGEDGEVDIRREFLSSLEMARERLSSKFGKSMPEVFHEMDRALGAARINERIAEISKATHGRFTSGTVESALNIVRGYKDDEIRSWILESEPDRWMEKPSFFKALAIVAKERFSVR